MSALISGKWGLCPAFASLAVALVSTSASANQIWRVDDNGGPGIDFRAIQPAVDAASSGDVIVVFPGVYRGFSMNKGLTILGAEASNTTVILESVTISGLPGPKRAVLSGLVLAPVLEINVPDGPQFGSPGALYLNSNLAPIVLDNLTIGNHYDALDDRVQVGNCSDVRMYQCTVDGWYGPGPGGDGFDGVQVEDSHFEVVDSFLTGAVGQSHHNGAPGGQGGPGLNVSNSIVSVFKSTCRGGRGGSSGNPDSAGGLGGDGGHGLLLDNGSVALVGGIPSDELRHGEGGLADCWLYCIDGLPGFGLLVKGASMARHSGVTITTESVGVGSVSTVAVPDDPFLERFGTLKAGELQTFWINGPPGAAVTLYFGRGAVVAPGPLPGMDNLVTHERAFGLGTIPASGQLSFNFTIPTSFPIGFSFFAQAELSMPTWDRLTNSLPIVVRHLP